MRKTAIRVMALMALLTPLGPTVSVPTGAAPTLPQEEKVYEDFSACTHKDYTETAERDIWKGHLVVSLLDIAIQSSEAVAPKSVGGIFFVWQDTRIRYHDTYSQHLNASNSSYGPPTRAATQKAGQHISGDCQSR
jgi:hypothetical protein